MFNLVGFQTRLKWGEQTRVLRTIPGLENVEIVRYGVIHKNIFINSPASITPGFQCLRRPDLFFAGQLTGVEGYVESAAAGLMAGLSAVRAAQGIATLTFPRESVLGSLAHYITAADPRHFQPMNSNWALLPPLEAPDGRKKWRKDEKAPQYVLRGQAALREFLTEEGLK